jgi:GNAT superfamily N-acetyltransferase
MNDYIIRKAIEKDIPFLADVVIAAEKSNSDKLSYATLFNISEEKARQNIISMFEEEIEGCEFSFDSFLIAEYNGEPVASFGGWIEGQNEDGVPSKILKSNLISYTFGKDCIQYLTAKSPIIKDILTEREPNTLQFEYLFVSDAHRGQKLSDRIIEAHEQKAKALYPELKKAQVQLYSNNTNAVRVYERNGFKIAQSLQSQHDEILDYLPFNEKYTMEKNY